MPGNDSTSRRLHVSIHSELTLQQKENTRETSRILAAAAAVLVCVWLGVWHFTADGHGSTAFAQILEQIQKAKTISWKLTFYERITSKDGKRTWLDTNTRQCDYKSPGLYREVEFDEKGQTKWVNITDATQKQQKQLTLIPAKKEAILCEPAVDRARIRLGRLNGLRRTSMTPTCNGWKHTKRANGTVNVFRHSMRDEANGRNWSYDFWIDQKDQTNRRTACSGQRHL